MTADTARPIVAVASGTSLRSRLTGLGTVYGKTIRDSRRSVVLVSMLIAFLTLTGGAAIAAGFGTAETRLQAAGLAAALPPVFQGLLGRPVGLTTLGGFIEWRYVTLFAVLVPIWSILSLSATLAGEASRGSLELVVTSAISRRRVALQKLAAHLTVVVVAMLVLAVVTYLTGVAFATLPGDEIPMEAAVGYAALIGVMILIPGAVAFASAPFVGRGAAAGLAAVAMLAAYFSNGFKDTLAAFEALAPFSWFAWTENHIPLAGMYDWGSFVLPAVVIAVLLVIGVVGFERRDMASTIHVPSPHLPGFLIGLRGPLGRSVGERIPAALAWGLAIGLYVLLLSSTAEVMSDLFSRLPAIEAMLRAIYPDADLESVGGVLQIVFLEFGLILFGFAAATIVAGWSSDETSGRLEVILSNPLTRASWLIRSGLGAMLAIVLSAAVVAAATAIGSASQASDIITPTVGSFVLALYGCAFAGAGMAVAGLVRSSLAAPVVVVLTVATFLITIFAVPLDLPTWLSELALSSHYGSPLVGDWDPVGVIASLVFAVGGLLVGAWGLGRRDVRV